MKRLFFFILICIATPVMSAPKYIIQERTQFGGWRQYRTVYHLPSASKSTQDKATQSGKQYRIIDEDGNLVDLFYP